MKNIKLVIFDLDGTLVDAYPAIVSSFNYAMKRLGAPAQDALTIRKAVGWGDEALLSPFLNPVDLKKALRVYRQHHRSSLLRHSRLLPGARQVLRYFKSRGCKLAVASNRPTEFSRILIRHLGLKQYFDYLLCGDKLKQIKPHPQILLKIMQKLSVSKKDCLYVGDMAIDAQAGRRAGINTVIVTTGSSTKQEIKQERPYRIIPGIKELLRLRMENNPTGMPI